jgi:hypothetical protein
MDCDKCGREVHGTYVDAVEQRRAHTQEQGVRWVDGQRVTLHPQCFNPHDPHYRGLRSDQDSA